MGELLCCWLLHTFLCVLYQHLIATLHSAAVVVHQLQQAGTAIVAVSSECGMIEQTVAAVWFARRLPGRSLACAVCWLTINFLAGGCGTTSGAT